MLHQPRERPGFSWVCIDHRFNCYRRDCCPHFTRKPNYRCIRQDFRWAWKPL